MIKIERTSQIEKQQKQENKMKNERVLHRLKEREAKIKDSGKTERIKKVARN